MRHLVIPNRHSCKWTHRPLRTWFEKNLDYLPLTAEAVSKHVESFECYLLRKVRWTKDYYRRLRRFPTEAARADLPKNILRANNDSARKVSLRFRISAVESAPCGYLNLRSLTDSGDLEA